MSFYVGPSGKSGFRIIQDEWQRGVRVRKTISKRDWNLLGIREGAGKADAVEICKRLNSIDQQRRRGHLGSAAVVRLRTEIRSAYLLDPHVQAFESWARRMGFGCSPKFISRWRAVQKLIVAIEAFPHEYHRRIEEIYLYLRTKRYSPDYSSKLIGLLNRFGRYICEVEQQKVYIAVSQPTGMVKQRIRDSYLDSEGHRGESEPLTPELITMVRSSLTVPGNFEWLFVSLWMGLRPSEVNALAEPTTYQVYYDKDAAVTVLAVYQDKLVSLPREKRWKHIPILFEEQRQAVEFIKGGRMKAPLYKTMKRVFPERITLYGGRKGFECLMLSRGRLIEEISAWLGHQSLDMTWRKYRNRQKVRIVKRDFL